MGAYRKLFIFICLFSSFLYSEEECDEGMRAMRVVAKHLEGPGVGYSKGYTTLEGFFAPSHCYGDWKPFLDLRGHVFNNGNMAANAGIGIRRVGPISWGFNSYYDYRNTEHYHYNQVGVGLEAIGSFWGVTVNGYLPVGKKKSPFYHRKVTGPGQIVDPFFQEHFLYLTLSGSQKITAKQEFAFKGIDANASFRVFKHGIYALDVGIGPYYFDGDFGKYAAGGKGAIIARFTDYVSVTLSGSYDNLFHGRVQGGVAFSVPFGPRNFGKKCTDTPCSIPSFADLQLASGVNRNEIVVVDDHKKILATAFFSGTDLAIAPATDLPYFFWFVNNLNGDPTPDGTFENPYPTLVQAETSSSATEIIYVFTGDGTSTGMDGGITLKNSQQLLGSSTPHSLPTQVGLVTIQPLSVGLPIITNPAGTVVELANNNRVSGFQIGDLLKADPINGIDGVDNDGDLTIDNNVFTASIMGINFGNTGTTGTWNIANNSFSNQSQVAMNLNIHGGTHSVIISSNTLAGSPSISFVDGIRITPDAGAILDYTVTDNLIQNYTAIGLNSFAGVSTVTAVVSGNTIEGVVGTSFKGIALNTGGSGFSTLVATVQGNTLSDFTQADLFLDVQGTSTINATVRANFTYGTSGGGSPIGIELDTDDSTSSIVAVIEGNTSQSHTGAEILISSRGTNTTINATINDNICTDVRNVGIQALSLNSSTVNASISGNQVTGATGFSSNGISMSTSAMSAFSVSNNTIAECRGAAIAGTFNGTTVISVDGNTINGNNLANTAGVQLGASIASVLLAASITNNTIANCESSAVAINLMGTQQLHAAINNNTITVGNVFGSSFGIIVATNVAVSQDVVMRGNTVITPAGGIGSQFGMVFAGFSPSAPQTVTVSNNTVEGCGLAPPMFGFTAGVGVSNNASGSLFSVIEANTLTNNGGFGVGAANVGGGTYCLHLLNNQGTDGYSLVNTGIVTDYVYEASGNSGVLTPTNVTQGICP